MKKYLFILFFLFLSPLAFANIPPDCTYKGIALHGRVQVVDYLADFDVQIVSFLPDLHVQEVSFLPTACGEWQFVDSMPDFTIRFVNALPDFTIQFVDYLPGLG